MKSLKNYPPGERSDVLQWIALALAIAALLSVLATRAYAQQAEVSIGACAQDEAAGPEVVAHVGFAFEIPVRRFDLHLSGSVGAGDTAVGRALLTELRASGCLFGGAAQGEIYVCAGADIAGVTYADFRDPATGLARNATLVRPVLRAGWRYAMHSRVELVAAFPDEETGTRFGELSGSWQRLRVRVRYYDGSIGPRGWRAGLGWVAWRLP